MKICLYHIFADPDGRVDERLIPDVPVAIYGLSDEVKARYKSFLEQKGSDYLPEEVIVLAEGKGEPITEQMAEALRGAQAKTLIAAMPAGDCAIRTGGGFHHAVSFCDPRELSSNIKGKEIPLRGILLCRNPLVDEPRYIRARDILVREANKTLRIFDAEFRIPSFPPKEKRLIIN